MINLKYDTEAKRLVISEANAGPLFKSLMEGNLMTSDATNPESPHWLKDAVTLPICVEGSIEDRDSFINFLVRMISTVNPEYACENTLEVKEKLQKIWLKS